MQSSVDYLFLHKIFLVFFQLRIFSFATLNFHYIFLLRCREKIQKVKIENKILESEYQKNKKLLDEANASKVRDTRNMKMFKKVIISI